MCFIKPSNSEGLAVAQYDNNSAVNHFHYQLTSNKTVQWPTSWSTNNSVAKFYFTKHSRCNQRKHKTVMTFSYAVSIHTFINVH